MITAHLTIGDGKALHISMVVEYRNEETLRHALELAVPHLISQGIATVNINTMNWKLGVATVQQNKNMERSERYSETGN